MTEVIRQPNCLQFVRGIMKKVNSDDCIVCHTFVKSRISVRLRVLQIHLKDSENNDIIEILLTNIFEDDFTPEEFKELYHLRWGIETKYDDIKNKLEIESFSGTSPLAVRQDFFATMFLNNLASMMIAETDCIIPDKINISIRQISIQSFLF